MVMKSKVYKHDKSLHLLNQLATDLKKRELGMKHGAITIERIDDIFFQVRQDLEQCWQYTDVRH